MLKDDTDTPVLEVDVIEHVDKFAGSDFSEGHTFLRIDRLVEKQVVLHVSARLPFFNKKVGIARDLIKFTLSKSSAICNGQLKAMKFKRSAAAPRQIR
jgi:hypothetical protein